MRRIHWFGAGVFLALVLLFSGLTADRCFQAPPSITDDGARKIMIANIREYGTVFLHFPDGKSAPGEGLLRLMRHWKAQNIRECTLILSPRYRKFPDRALLIFL